MTPVDALEPPDTTTASSRRAKKRAIPAPWNDSQEEYRMVLNGDFTWEQFLKVQHEFEAYGRRRGVSYLDGTIEILMSISLKHEQLGGRLGGLIERYFQTLRREYLIWGSATLRSKAKRASCEPDKGYILGSKVKKRPDFAIEIALTSGGIEKLEVYRRFKVPEVLIFRKGRLLLFRWCDDNYEEVTQSILLPGITVALLTDCLLAKTELEAIDLLLGEIPNS